MPAETKPYIGGQAVVDGIMLRSPSGMVVAVRAAGGRIVLREDVWRSISHRIAILRVPVLRGAVVFLESLYNGLVALQFSAAHAAGAPELAARRPRDVLLLLATSLSLAIGIFFVLPHGLAALIGFAAGGDLGRVDRLPFHLLDGALKLAVFVGYLAMLRRIPDARKLFRYHGAEHKVIHAYEAGVPLELAAVRSMPTFHPRCGTSFILMVLALSIFAFAVALPLLPPIQAGFVVAHLGALGLKLPLLLPIAGAAYEVNRALARRIGRPGAELLLRPGRWLQRLTTAEPDDRELEVAVLAMRAAVAVEAAPSQAPRRAVRTLGPSAVDERGPAPESSARPTA